MITNSRRALDLVDEPPHARVVSLHGHVNAQPADVRILRDDSSGSQRRSMTRVFAFCAIADSGAYVIRTAAG